MALKLTKYFISAVPNAKNDSVEVVGPNILRVRIAAKPVDGEANQRLIKVLAEYFNVSKSSVRLKAGSTFRQKIVEISADQPES